jgi:DNA polymerase
VIDPETAGLAREAAAALRTLLKAESDFIEFVPACRPVPRPAPAPRSGPVAPPPSRPAVPAAAATPAAPATPVVRTDAIPRFLEALGAVRPDLDAMRTEVESCTACSLAGTRTRTVFGEGRIGAAVMFVGEGPGQEEDRTGRPFVGAAGELLDRIIAAMGLRREDQYICNVVKCRPPENATPLPDQVRACLPFLERQILAVRPSVLVALGGTAARALLGGTAGVAQRRGIMTKRGDNPVIVTYHPAALLREPSRKRDTWEDMKLVMGLLKAS